MEKIKKAVDEIKVDLDKNILERVNIRKVTKNDLELYVDLMTKETWNKGIDHTQYMIDNCPGGFWCAEIDSKNVVAFCGGYDIGNNKAVIVNYVTKKNYRKKGIGRVLFDKVMNIYKDHEIFLNSVAGIEEMYGRSGFQTEIYKTRQIVCEPVTLTSKIATGSLLFKANDEKTTISEFNSLTEEIYNYDSKITPFLRNIKWFIETSEYSFVARNHLNQVSGFACVRRVPNGLSFQPFYADNAETAERLIIKCRSKNWKNETVQFFVPDGNDECREILKNYYKIIHEYPNTWLGNKSTFSVDEKKMFSILDFCCSVC